MSRAALVAAMWLLLTGPGLGHAAEPGPLVRLRLRGSDVSGFVERWLPLLPDRLAGPLAAELAVRRAEVEASHALEISCDRSGVVTLLPRAEAPAEWPAGSSLEMAGDSLGDKDSPWFEPIGGSLSFTARESRLHLEATPHFALGNPLLWLTPMLQGLQVHTAEALPRNAFAALMVEWKMTAALLALIPEQAGKDDVFLPSFGLENPKPLLTALAGGAGLALLDFDPERETQPETLLVLRTAARDDAAKAMSAWETRLAAGYGLRWEALRSGAHELRAAPVPILQGAYPAYAFADDYLIVGYTPGTVATSLAALDDGTSLAPALARDGDGFAVFYLDFQRLKQVNAHLTAQRSQGKRTYTPGPAYERSESLVVRLRAEKGKYFLDATLRARR